jgi:hypothetical protein
MPKTADRNQPLDRAGAVKKRVKCEGLTNWRGVSARRRAET